MLSADLENWMTNIPEPVRRNVPIIYLAIPGSHDSATYGINSKSKLAPDAEDIVKKIYPFIPCFVIRWAKTQKFSFRDQLNSGIRYFDLRVAANDEEDEKVYFVHGLFCEEVTQPFNELLKFLREHPKEFVILDFQHFYNFSRQNHHKLIILILNLFREIIFERNRGLLLNQLTLGTAHSLGKQLIIIYRKNLFTIEAFFSSHEFPTPWANATSIRSLKEFLEQRLSGRHPHQGFITQCILTPDVRFITFRFYSSLRRACAKKVDKNLSEWIKAQTPGEFKKGEKPTPNIFLADFTDIRNNNFCKIVVDLNMKLESSFVDNSSVIQVRGLEN
ncbi:CLUMA_CG013240, isoform A [Clunio marinus]|uniref:CLUMA_CG013240, isoform A n=1 Tax=Clunio marinus TaxID=568069 RepID=A0A1J1II62_9DIPT|nr:CLUMA_CG013240, isoform A [Clunio marinus]